MTKEARNPNDERSGALRTGAPYPRTEGRARLSSARRKTFHCGRHRLRASSFFRHSDFVIRHFLVVALFLLPFIASAADEAKPPAPQPIAIREIKRRSQVDFESEVLPILKANCLACHNQTATKGDLVLETPQTIRKGGESGPAVVPGKPNESLMLQIASHQKRPLMPPKENKVAASDLKPEELGLIKLWIEQGAKGEVRASIPVQWRPLSKAVHPIYASAITRDGQFAACGRGNQIYVYHIPSTQLVAQLVDSKLKMPEAAHLDLVQSLDFSPDGTLLASGAFREVKLWRRSLESKIVRLPNLSTNAVIDLAPDGSLMAVLAGTNQLSLRDSRSAAERQKITVAGSPLTRVRFSPDSKRIASLSTNGLLEVWGTKDGKLLAKTNLATDSTLLTWVAAKEIATVSSGTNIQVWHISSSATQSVVLRNLLAGHSLPVTALAGSSNSVLSAESGGNVRLWDVKKGESVREIKHGSPITALALSADGQRFAFSGSDKIVRLGSAEEKKMSELKGDRYLNEAVQRAERRATLASNEVAFRKSALQSAETQRSNQLARVTKATETNAVAQKIFPEKQTKLAASEKARSAAEKLVVDLQERLAKCISTSITNGTNSAALSLTNAVVSTNAALSTNAVALTNSSPATTNELNAKLKEALAKLTTASNDVAAAEKEFKKAQLAQSIITHELELATNALGKAVQAVSEAKGLLEKSETLAKAKRSQVEAALKRAADAEQVATALAFSPDNRVLASVADNAVYTWNAQSGAAFDVYRATNGGVRNVAFTSPNLLVAASGGALWQWNMRPLWRLERTIGGDKIESPFVDRVNTVRFSPDGKTLATGGGQPSRSGEIKIWNVADGKLQRDLPGIHSDAVLSLDFSPDGASLASGGADKFLRVSSVQSGKLIKSFEGHTHHVLGVGWKQDGRTLVSAGADTLVKVWNFATGERLKNVEGFGKEVTSVTFVGVTGQFLAAGGDGQLRLVRENGENVKSFPGASDFLYSSAATPDGKIILAGGQDGILRTWTADGRPAAEFGP